MPGPPPRRRRSTAGQPAGTSKAALQPVAVASTGVPVAAETIALHTIFELVRNRERWYAERPDYVQRMTERGGRYLFHIVEELDKLGAADKLDTLVGFWIIGEKPTGSGDPYQLRRAALGDAARAHPQHDVRLASALASGGGAECRVHGRDRRGRQSRVRPTAGAAHALPEPRCALPLPGGRPRP